MKRIRKIRTHVISDDSQMLIRFCKKSKTGKNTDVTTAASTITDMNGHRSHRNNNVDKIKTARKYHVSIFLLIGSFTESFLEG